MIYDIILKDAGYQQFAVIRLVKELTGLGLRETKEFVETVPNAIKKGITKNEAEALKKSLEEIGAKAEILRDCFEFQKILHKYLLISWLVG